MKTIARTNLDEVSFIRPILIILLVLFHSFAIFSGAWSKPNGIEDVPAYSWVARSAYALMLQCFVFLSGYLWSYQRETLDRKVGFWDLALVKFNRLIIPCLVFGVLYSLMIESPISLKDSLFYILEGAGHLWFLPMLFWCFVFGYPIVFRQRNPIFVLVFLFILSFFSVIPFPFRVSMSFYYLFFFIGGYYCWQFKESILQVLESKKELIWILFVLSFVCLSIWADKIDCMSFFQAKTQVSKIVSKEIHLLFSTIYATLGTIALWLSSLSFVIKHHLSKWWIELGQFCMGVYVFQQFILKYLYYQTGLPFGIITLLLPWIAFVIALVGSLLLSYTIKQV